MTTTASTEVRARGVAPQKNALYNALLGLASLAVLLQGVWAGLFVQEGKEYDQSWVEWHARGADVAIVLAALATVVAFVKLRERKDLWLGTGLLTVVLVVEAYIGGIIGQHSRWTVVHFPLAMTLMALVVYLPLRAARKA